ncbi:MAG TPA: hypothetical protein VFE47_02980 [Tepidisphaeraceae bacterium]|jgi:hypothetical protein|nr:hypothetical protein [Tepidisphaeraceae bacterium]
MSQSMPPINPLPYAGFIPRPPDPRPASVRAIAVIAFIFAALGLFGGVCSIPQYLGLNFGSNPVVEGVSRDPVLRWFTVGSLAIGMILALVLLWAGKGLLALKPAARSGIIAYAVIYVVISLAGLIVNLAFLNARMQKVTQAAMKNNPMLNTPAMKTIMQYSTYGGILMSVAMLAWPIAILYVMSRPHVKAAFERGMPGKPV